MKRHITSSVLIFVFVCGFFQTKNFASTIKLSSPDGKISIKVNTKDSITYMLFYEKKEIIATSPVCLYLNNGTAIGKSGKPKISRKNLSEQTINPVVPIKHSKATYLFNEIRLTYPNNNGIIFRIYDDGLAYRFFTRLKDSVTITKEDANFVLSNNWMIYKPSYETFHSSQEELYNHAKVSSWKADSLCYTPILIESENNVKLLITEADLTSYAGMWLTRENGAETTLSGRFPLFPKKEKQTKDRTIIVEEKENYIAKTNGSRQYPWRVIGVFENDKQIIESDLIYRLGPELAFDNTEWIKPGKVAWDWWNANNIYNVNFEAGINTKTYKHYIDFAAENNLEYIILDEGWSDTKDLLKINPEINLQEIINYGNEKDVGVILWCVWCTLDKQMEKALSAFEEWGAKGIKVDFMDRDDQKMVDYYHDLSKACANHKLLLNMHAAYKPTGIRKAYPNFLTREGVLGQEFNKWSGNPNPEYAVTIPFIRMFAGPMDYTPGAMHNAQEENFASVFTRPMSKGTRAHQIAMYIIFESPMQMLCDAPTAYKNNPECTSFISKVPVTWDKTICLDAKISDYLVVARKKNNTWYLGSLTDWSPREIKVDLSFLPEGKYKAEIISDGINAHRNALDHKHNTQIISNETSLKIKLAPGGGWAAILTPK